MYISKIKIRNFRKLENVIIDLEKDTTLFVGANNSGKSQVLKDIEHELDKSDQTYAIIIDQIGFDYYGSINESQFFNEHFKIDHNGYYHFSESSNGFTQEMLKQYWESHTLYNELHKLFIKRLSTEIRLTSSNALNRHSNPEKHPIYKLNNNERLSQKLSDYFHQAFGVDLIINRNEMQTIPLHIGKAPDKEAFTIATQDDYYNQISALPKLQDQGDGMRSFASILLDTFTSDYPITLIDEPEAFLHPPQARILGKMLAKYILLLKNGSYRKEDCAAIVRSRLLTGYEQNALAEMLYSLGKSDIDTQLSELNKYRALISPIAAEAGNNYKKYGSLAFKLGILAGLAALLITA